MKQILISLALIIPFLASAADSASLKRYEESKQVIIQEESVIQRGQFTTAIKDKEPVDKINQLGSAYDVVFYYSEIVNYKGQTVYHEWYYEDELLHKLKVHVIYDRYRVWSRIKNLHLRGPGEYKVKVTNEAGEVLAESTLTYFEVTQQQIQQAPIQEQLELRKTTECERKLEYYNGQLLDHPGNAYYKFMLRKWGKRCLDDS